MAGAVDELQRYRQVVCVTSVNDPASRAQLASDRFDLGLVVGADVVSRATLRQTAMPLLNLHLSDPTFARGLPGVFWEVHGGRSSILLTLHELVKQLDAGAVVGQHEVPIAWRRSLGETLAATRVQAALGIRDLLLQMWGSEAAEAAEPAEQALRGGVSRELGPLRTTPTVRQLWHAMSVCRRRGEGQPIRDS